MTAENSNQVQAFFDLRSPYSYLAIGPARALALRHGLDFDWWPFTTDFRGAYGGEVEDRTRRDVAKVKYLYMDCRRLAQQQGLTIRATHKLWDVRLANQAVLFAKSQGRFWEFCDPLLSAFWRREFDLESPAALENALVNAGLDARAWQAFQRADAEAAWRHAQAHADMLGVFGAPTFIYRNEMFWGGDRLNLLEDTVTRSRP
jgi:2-hydroxychromene-2-carboxylate isomerase